MRVWIVEGCEGSPEAVFSSLEKAEAWVAEFGSAYAARFPPWELAVNQWDEFVLDQPKVEE